MGRGVESAASSGYSSGMVNLPRMKGAKIKKRLALAAIFAHPDDEAFGPGGTLARFAKKNDVYILCATKGQAGKDSRSAQKRTLGDVRADELRRSAKILGVKKVFFLDYEDGMLSNSIYHELAGRIARILKKITPEIILTFEPRGISGHIDHIAVSMISSFVYERMRGAEVILYHCITKERAEAQKKGYFIYIPPGYRRDEIDLVVHTKDVWDVKVRAMREHTSQAHDILRILKRAEKFPKEEYFLLRAKHDTKKWLHKLRTILDGKKQK